MNSTRQAVGAEGSGQDRSGRGGSGWGRCAGTESRVRVLLVALGAAALTCAASADSTIWPLTATASVGGHACEVLGSPVVATGPEAPAVVFDGVDDALLVPVNPVAGWRTFTVEILFKVAPDGAFEQRFLHLGTGTADRALLELRLTPDGGWYLDGFLRVGTNQLTLVDPAKLHRADTWAWAALRYDGARLSSYVNGELQAGGALQVDPLPAGRTSLGVRMTRISWFKGAIREVRFHDSALAPEALQKLRQ